MKFNGFVVFRGGLTLPVSSSYSPADAVATTRDMCERLEAERWYIVSSMVIVKRG